MYGDVVEHRGSGDATSRAPKTAAISVRSPAVVRTKTVTVSLSPIALSGGLRDQQSFGWRDMGFDGLTEMSWVASAADEIFQDASWGR